MKLNPQQTLDQIAKLINAKMHGPADHVVSGINEIHKVETGDLLFVDHPKYYDKALQSAATTILIDKEVEVPKGKAILVSDNPFRDYNFLTQHFSPLIHLSEDRGKNVQIGDGTKIYPGVVIGNNVSIGNDCQIHSNVVIEDGTQIGNNVIIHSNTVIGADAFYYKKTDGEYTKMHSCGWVEIGDHVEIGPLCTIDKGVSGNTKIGAGSKLDAQVHVGHDTVIGKNCLFAAQVGIAGCVIIEDGVTLWGQVGVPSDLTIGENAVFLGQSAPARSVEGNKTYFGSPATEARTKMKELALLKKLPEMLKKLNGGN
ncbi:MAG: UDP-3-O-(3-hydroxymyristoyl)glucosamine N-acyltransferase [Flavobacteriales bacterium]|nr:UDP-3-O-(3-hydroxymyristoyl)glucosamine N-acyltransferase [Flavobacteriales bacterium]